MFEKRKSDESVFGFPNKSINSIEQEDSNAIENKMIDVKDFMSRMDSEIKSTKQSEKNATIARIYSVNGEVQKKSEKSGCGCFGH